MTNRLVWISHTYPPYWVPTNRHLGYSSLKRLLRRRVESDFLQQDMIAPALVVEDFLLPVFVTLPRKPMTQGILCVQSSTYIRSQHGGQPIYTEFYSIRTQLVIISCIYNYDMLELFNSTTWMKLKLPAVQCNTEKAKEVVIYNKNTDISP